MSSSLIVVLLKWSDRDSISGTYHLARLVDPMVYRRRGHFSEIDLAAATPKSRANRRAGLIGGYGRFLQRQLSRDHSDLRERL